MELIKCGIDGGNSTIVTIIEGKKMSPYFPSISANASYINYSIELGINDSRRSLYSNLHVCVENQFGKNEFIFGHMAEDYPSSQKSRINTEKFNDRDLINWQIASLAYHLYMLYREKKIVNVDEKVLNFSVQIGVGLPYHEAVDKSKKLKYAQSFFGKHVVKFKHPAFSGLVIHIDVKKVKVNVEGEASIDMILNNPDSVYATTSSMLLKDSIIVMIDIGGYTIEIIGVQFRQEDLDSQNYDEFAEQSFEVYPVTRQDLTKGLSKGVGSIMNNVISDIKRYKSSDIRRTLTRRDIEKAMANKHNGQNGWITPELINISEYFTKYSREFGKELAKDFINLYSNADVASKVREIYLTGGGSRIPDIVTSFKQELALRNFNTDLVICLKDAIYSNAQGYYESLL